MPGPKSKKEAVSEGRAIAESHGLKLCDCCLKSNEDSLKALTFMTSLTDIKEKAADKELSELSEEIREIKMIVRKNENKLEKLNQEFRTKLEDFTSVSMKKIEENQKATKDWSSLFKNKVKVLVSDVQKSMVDTKTSIELNAERILRKNNIVAYNVPENAD